MGSSTSSFPDFEPPVGEHPARDGSFATYLPPPPQPPDLVFGDPGDFWRREPKRRYIILFVLTLLSTTLIGAAEYWGFMSFGPIQPSWGLLLAGTWYSIPVLTILGAHEFGHYLACVYYRVNASLPYFLPLPLPPAGTLGAVIRIRQPIPGKRALFDIGIAGPLAGFVVLVPVLFLGMTMSKVISIPPAMAGQFSELGEPLLLRLIEWFVFGSIPEGKSLILHPMGMAAWWGMFATSLNLLPIGQLDGGHITYAVLGRRSTIVTIAAVLVMMGLTAFVSMSWTVWTGLMIVMLLLLGPRHPHVHDEDQPLDRVRLGLAVVSLIVFIICFTPTPFDLGGLFAG
jgi:membrane-associated protease RseP (regulator of RpoE activity)